MAVLRAKKKARLHQMTRKAQELKSAQAEGNIYNVNNNTNYAIGSNQPSVIDTDNNHGNPMNMNDVQTNHYNNDIMYDGNGNTHKYDDDDKNTNTRRGENGRSTKQDDQ